MPDDASATATQTEPETLGPADVIGDAPASGAAETAPTPDSIHAAPASLPVGKPVEPELPSREELLAIENGRLKAMLSAAHNKLSFLKDLANDEKATEDLLTQAKAEVKTLTEERDEKRAAIAAAARGDAQCEIGEFKQAEQPKQETLDTAMVQKPRDEDVAVPNNAGEAMEVTDLDWSQVKLSALSQLLSTGKAPQVKPIEQKTGALLVLTHVDRPTAVFHRLLTEQEFKDTYPNAKRFAKPSDMPADSKDLLGFPVRFGRPKFWLCSNEHAWHVQIPPTATIDPSPVEVEIVAKHVEPGEAPFSVAPPETLAGPGFVNTAEPLADRMAKRLAIWPANSKWQHVARLDPLAADLRVTIDAMRAVIATDPRFCLEQFDGDEVVRLADAP